LEKVSLIIDDVEFAYWTEVEIKLSLDAFATVAFGAPFELEREEFREIFRPFSFLPVALNIGEERVFTGTLIDVEPKVDADAKTVQVSAYATPGVLEDCTPHDLSFPLEFNNLGLRAIAERLAAPFGIHVRFEAPEGAKFKRVACDPDKKIHEFLSDLARQRGLVITNTADGQLLFRHATFGLRPVARLIEGVPPLTKVSPKFNPRSYYSQLTGLAPVHGPRSGGKYTTKNPRLNESHTRKGRIRRREIVGLSGVPSPVMRPLTVKLNDTEIADVPHAVRAKLGRMFGNMVSWSLERIPTWRDPKGFLWKPNTTLMLTAPSAMVFSEYELLVREVTLKQDGSSTTANLDVVLPGTFSGEIPQRFPWD
jgi:prophage tail gpP-like protein